MTSRLEIRLKKDLLDPEGNKIKQKAKDYFGFSVTDVRTIKVLTFDIEFNSQQFEDIRSEIFTNPVTEESSFSPMARDFDWLIWIGFRPGVRDTGGSTAMEAIEDFLKIKLKDDEAVYTSKIYEIRGDLNREDAETIAKEILSNDIIQQYKVYSGEEWDSEKGIGIILPKVILDHVPNLETISIKLIDEQIVYEATVPDQNEGIILNNLTEQIDLPPTILSLANIPVPSWMEGRSLVPLLRSDELPLKHVYSMSFQNNPSIGGKITNGTIAVWENDYKLIHYLEKNKSLLFNLKSDPDELNDLFDKEKETGQRLLALIQDNLRKANEQISKAE